MSAETMMCATDIHARISWPVVLAQLGLGELPTKKKPGPCPACGGTDRFMFDNRRGCGDWHCRHCEPHAGDGFDLLMRVHGWDFATARKQVMQAAGLADRDEDAPIIQRHAPTRDAAPVYRPWKDLAATLWEQHRGCALPPADGDLRYLPARGAHPAAMVARVTDVITAAPISLHFTRLNPDGSKHADGKRLLGGHRKAGGCIRLWPDEAVTTGLAIAEGIESALSAAHAFTPIWAAIDAGNLAAFPVLGGIEALTLFADNDPAGMSAARTCAARWADAGREAFITMPARAGADINDVVSA